MPETQPQPVVLRLPEVPKGTAALIGGRTGQRYPRGRLPGGWKHPSGGVIGLGELLAAEGKVTVETAPPPAAVENDLLDLVRQYGAARQAQGVEAAHGSAPGQYHAKRQAAQLLARITEQLHASSTVHHDI